MKRFFVIFLAAVIALSLSTPVFAGDSFALSDLLFGNRFKMDADTDKDEAPPVDGLVHAQRSASMRLTGKIKLDVINRSQYLNSRLSGNQERSTIYDPEITLGMKFFAGKDVFAFLELENPANFADEFGSDNPRFLVIEQVYVEIGSIAPDQFGEEAMKLRIGIQDIRFKLRDGGGAFFMDVSESESPFWPGSTPGDPMTGDGVWITDENDPFYNNNGYFEFSGPGLASSREFGGFHFIYDLEKKKGVKADFLFGITKETGADKEDESLIMAALTYSLPRETGKVQTYLSMFSNDPSSRVWTFGLGTLYKAKQLEFFFEAAGQGGTFIENYDSTNPSHPNDLSIYDGTGDDIKQLAFGGYVGFRYSYKSRLSLNPFVEMSYWYLSGDRDQSDRRQQNFLSFEDVDDSIIVEENEAGLDVDTNYHAFKFKFGFEPSKQMSLEFLYAYFSRARDRSVGDRIAQEADVRLKWNYTESCSFELGIGHAFDMQYIRALDHKEMTLIFMDVTLDF